MSRGRRLATLALLATVLLAGCSGGLTGGAGDGAPVEEASTAAADGSDGGDGGGAGSERDGSAALQVRNRAVIKTGAVHLRVASFDAARGELVAVAASRGGYVAGSSETTHRVGNRTWTEGTLVLKVPSETFGAAFREVKGVGRVLESTSDTKDVTDRLVDLEARLANLRAQRDRLRALYEEANDTEAVLRVGERLSSVQGRIERLEAEKRALEGRVAYATIRVRFAEERPPEPTPAPPPAYHETALGRAFLASVHGVVVTLRTLAVTLAYLAPYLATLGVPVAGAAYLYRRRGSFPTGRTGE